MCSTASCVITPDSKASEGLSQHWIKSHIAAHLGTLLLVMHQELAVLEVLPLLFALGGYEVAAHSQAGQFASAPEPGTDAFSVFFTKCLDDFVVERDEELRFPGISLAGTPAGELAVDAARFMPLGS